MTSEEKWTAEELGKLDWGQLCELGELLKIVTPRQMKREVLEEAILQKQETLPTGTGEGETNVSPPSTPEEKKYNVASMKSGDVVQIEPELEVSVAPQPTFRFWVGTLPNSPFQNVTAGITFPAWTGAYRGINTTTGEPIPPETKGTLVDLTEDEIELVIRRVSNLVFRPMGGGKYSSVVRNGKRYRPLAGDVPAGRFLFMQRVGRTMPVNFQQSGEYPIPMVEG